jgi:holo-[acyl-carrier protein] synthase
LGSGIGDVNWTEIEILGDEQNAPKLKLTGMAEQKAKELGLTTWSVSISHSQSHSVALVVALG